MTKKHKEISGGDNIQFKISQKYLRIQNQILIFVHKRMTMATKIKRRKMTRGDTCNTKTFCGELHIYPLKTLLK